MQIETVEVGGTIRLGQFLKYAGLVESGGHARELISAGAVSVDEQIVTERGRQLHGGETVRVRTAEYEAAARVG